MTKVTFTNTTYHFQFNRKVRKFVKMNKQPASSFLNLLWLSNTGCSYVCLSLKHGEETFRNPTHVCMKPIPTRTFLDISTKPNLRQFECLSLSDSCSNAYHRHHRYHIHKEIKSQRPHILTFCFTPEPRQNSNGNSSSKRQTTPKQKRYKEATAVEKLQFYSSSRPVSQL